MKHRAQARLYGLSEACLITGLGKTTIKSLVYSGELESIKVGRRRLIPVESIDKFIAARLESQVQS
jgi:excisionase family DNA binding protein